MTVTMTCEVSRRALGKAALAGIGVLGAAGFATSANAAASDLRSVSAAQRNADITKLLGLMNAYRQQNGVGPLRHSAIIASVMEGEARRQFIENAFSHSTTFLYSPKVQGYSFAREIISLSYAGNLEDLMSFWKSSPAHNSALLAPEANVCGIGFAYGNGGVLPWRVLGNVGIYRYEAGKGPNDYTATPGASSVQVYSSTATEIIKGETYPILAGIASRYNADGGANFYGQPLHAERRGALAGGMYQGFEKNGVRRTIYWHKNTGTGSIYERGGIAAFWRKNGSESGFGYPIMNEKGGLVGGGAYQKFQKGNVVHKVLWHPVYGTNVVFENGAIGREWARTGYERGAGYPLTGEYIVGIETHQRFSNGITIAWDSFTGAVRSFKG